ncbi:IS5 family transposase [Silicimonas sp. MF1-12-2]|uniref:IS5 family transposase n=1 Tax=Silicimonas sp. MF1-12-2 TaxID=3384793 RepID=UPI0039B51F3B
MADRRDTEHGEQNTVMIDATYRKAHRTATSMGVKKGGAWKPDWPNQGRHEHQTARICDSQGRSLNLFVTTGQVNDYIGARALVSSLPKVGWLLAARRYDTDRFREALKDKGIRACIPDRKQRPKSMIYDKRYYKRRNRIEIMSGRLKDWRRVATREDRCPKVFLSTIALAVIVICWP